MEKTRPAPQLNHQPVLGVERMIAIASGKGGVGKSTATVMLAHALAAQGQGVAILDADIYGPSIPKMLGLSGKPEQKDNLMQPLQAQGIRCNSMGFLLPDAKTATVWRGPMISKALYQLARGTKWAEDGQKVKLLVDFPPGTGDVQLSMAQQTPLDGALIVTTPQEVALADARKCADMFAKLNIPIVGVIENMSWFESPDGQRHYLFGEGGGRTLAHEIGVPLLAQVPQMPELMACVDAGKVPDAPIVAAYTEVLKVL